MPVQVCGHDLDNPEETYGALKKYGSDLVERARQNKLDPVIGRDDEIRNVIRIFLEIPAPRSHRGARRGSATAIAEAWLSGSSGRCPRLPEDKIIRPDTELVVAGAARESLKAAEGRAHRGEKNPRAYPLHR